MKVEFFDNDEIHHFEGKAPQDACPNSPPSASNNPGTSSPVSKSSFVAFPPPGMQDHKPRNRMKRFINRLFRVSNYKTKDTIMIFNGPVIMNFRDMYNGMDKKSSKEDAEEVDYEEVKDEPKREATNDAIKVSGKDYSKSPLIPFIIQKSKAAAIVKWLHSTMDSHNLPKEKLIYLRAIYEAGYFTRRIPYELYVEEFGYIVRSRYFDWMGKTLNYDRSEIDAIIEQLPF